MTNTEDKIYGMVIGHALGDALGCPHEFKPTTLYTGKLEHVFKRFNQYTKPTIRESVVGQTSDDTEMALALLYSLETGFSREKTVIEYMKWIKNEGFPGNAPFAGRNTRNLFVIGSTSSPSYKLYLSRFEKNFPTEISKQNAQSNGCLMRAYPLSLVDLNIARIDCSITNPSDIARDCVHSYVFALKECIKGKNKEEIAIEVSGSIKTEEVMSVFKQALNNEKRNVTGKCRGWCLHAYYCAFWALFNFNNYKAGIDAVICLDDGSNPPKHCGGTGENSDTDTNAAIAGALIGAYYGISKMCNDEITNENMKVLSHADSALGNFPRPEKYTMKNIEQILKLSWNIYLQNNK